MNSVVKFKLSQQEREFFRAMGAKGGKARGGKKRKGSETMRQLAKLRWAKTKP